MCSRGRVVKASDSKSDSLWERRFESYRLRIFFLNSVVIYNLNIYFFKYNIFLICSFRQTSLIFSRSKEIRLHKVFGIVRVTKSTKTSHHPQLRQTIRNQPLGKALRPHERKLLSEHPETGSIRFQALP